MQSSVVHKLPPTILVGLIIICGAGGVACEPIPDTLTRPGSPTKESFGNPLWSVSLASLTATRERPIFSPSRRPPPVALKTAPVQPPSKAQPPFILVGAIAGESEGIAIFLDGATNGVIRLKTGESHAGWMLQTVRPREAVLQKEQRTIVVELPNPPAK
jgi:general secretion pathway protein N